MKKKQNSFFYKNLCLLLMVFFMSNLGAGPDINPFGFEIEAETAFMIDLGSGQVLFSKKPHEIIHPASTTKVITALVAYEALKNRLDEEIETSRDMIGSISPSKKIASGYTLPPHWIEVASNHMGLKAGETMSIHNLLRGALIVSANDACNALALTTSGSYDGFMQRVNNRAKELGCLNTHFINAHGLYQPEHVSTVYDLTLMARALLAEPVLADIVNSRFFKRPKTNKQEPALMHNTTLMCGGKPYYSKACGVKGGYTVVSGASLIAAAKNESRFVLLTLSNCPSRPKSFEEAKKLLEAALEEKIVEKEYFKSGDFLPNKRRISGASQSVEAMVKDSIKLSFYPSQELSVKGRVVWDDLVPPVKKGQYVGRVEVIDSNQNVMASSILISTKDIEPELAFQVKHWASHHLMISCLAVFAGALILLFIFRSR